MQTAPLADLHSATTRAARLRQVLAVLTLAMMAATWRLWTVQTVYPRVPLLHAADSLPAAIEWTSLGLAVVGLAAAIGSNPRVWRPALRTVAAALTLLIVLDQHRLQPWAWQAILVSLALANCPAPRALTLVRLLTASIYLYSGWSKLDYEFLHTLGQQFVAALMGLVGMSLRGWPDEWRLAAAALLPLAEIALAVGFCLRRCWPAALTASVLLHGALLLVLGPWGLKHSTAVLLWNGYFIAQNLLLFRHRVENAAAADPNVGEPGTVSEDRPAGWLNLATQGLLVAAMLLPLTEPWGWWDAWPSWSLYAPNCERVTVLVHRRALDELDGLDAFVDAAADEESWLRLRIDRWSLAAVGAPIYPQNRFQLGVAQALAAGDNLSRLVRAIELGRADRFTGQRPQRTLAGLAEITAAGDQFLLGCRPDRRFRWPGPDRGAIRKVTSPAQPDGS